MSDVAILYVTDHDDPKVPLRELGIDDGDVKDFVEIASRPFAVTYGSTANRRIFNENMAQRMRTVDVVYAAIVSTTKGMAERVNSLSAFDGIICAGASVEWQSVNRVAELSRTYADLLERLAATEEKCMSLDRNSIRRRDLQESYEYLDGEIERLDNLLGSVTLTAIAP
jgi:hypothetical protein